MIKTVAVVGGGAAGLMASYNAAMGGARVYLFEKNPNLGRKILISGKGRCNLTNTKELDEFIAHFPGNGKFLFSSLITFSNKDLITFFKKLGVETKAERGGRVFPVSDRSLDILNALHSAVTNANVHVKYKSRVKDFIIENNKIKGIKFGDHSETFYCDNVIVATGGLSYPATGSTGDGYELARRVGHKVTELKPSLVPLIAIEKWIKDLQGL
ncbi:MAG: aminoacetone oxidase family FAD-binding enzyme, partial [Tepidanaerobacteraceae bacterium]|nr:aminoacetone oxidase family FAD-binding enzyme [Tepidanaerobacteraceae bacterium]